MPEVRTCPRCSGSAVKIAYGLPSLEGFEAAERGDIELGGCVIFEDKPDWHCRACGNEWQERPQH